MILSQSACSSCKSKEVCSIFDSKEKLITLKTDSADYRIGERVNVVLEEKTGTLAVLFAYVIPFIVMIIILVIGFYTKMNEPVIGGLVLVSLILYYIILYLFRDLFNKKVTFKVEKISNNDFQLPNENNLNYEV